MKRALLIGIDAYERINPLDGCVNDVKLMREVLSGVFGFPEDNMTMLLNEEATRDGILTALDAFVDSVGDDDLVVIHYAGHGSQMTDREGDEPSGLDSTIMPVDSEGWQGDNRDITDDEIHLRLRKLGEKTNYTTLIFDCCHSGTITRDSFGAKSRSMPADRRPVSELPPSPIPQELWGGSRGERGPSGWMALGEKYVLISGCRDEELSYEHRPADLGGRTAHGALTYFLSQELRKATSGTTYRDVYERAAAQVTAANGKQHPQMEGKADREIFGVRDIEPMRHVRVATRSGGKVTLAAGAALGMTKGSRYAVHPQGTKVPGDAEPLGTLMVTSVGATSAEAKIESESGRNTIVEGAYAFETEHAWGEQRLRVEIAGNGDEVAALKTVLEPEAILSVVPDGEPAAVRAYRVPERSEVQEGDPVPQLGAVRQPVWAIVGETGELVMPLQAAEDVEKVRDNLRTFARYRQLLALENPDPNSALRGKFSVDLLRQNEAGEWVKAAVDPESGHVVYEEGDYVAFEISSKHDKPVYASLIDFGLSGAVHLVHPMSGAQEQLRAEGFFTVGTRDEFDPLGFPEEFPFADDPVHGAPAEGLETVKLIITENGVDFSHLNQEGFVAGVATRGAEEESPLSLLFRSATDGGPTTRDFGRRTKIEDWTTVVKPFLLRRKRTAELDAANGRAALGGVTVVAPGLTGKVSLHEGGPREKAAKLGAGALFNALDEEHVEVRSTIELAGAQEVGPSSRSAGGAPAALEIELHDPGAANGQMLLTTNEQGVVSWHFAPPEAAGGSRGVGPADSVRGMKRTYIVPRTVTPAPAGGDGSRGLIAFAGSKLFKELVFPLIDPALGAIGEAFAGRWEGKKRPYGLRTFTPDNYNHEPGESLSGDHWRMLGEGRALLFVHGTFSRAHSAFGALTREWVEKLHRQYGGRVFAFDHFTLSHDPKQNVNWLIDQMPDDLALDVDIICHSRGGLVSRVLNEKQSELSLGSRSVRVGRIIFVGSPNAGTLLADGQHMGDFIDTYTNLINFIPDAGVTDVISGIVTVAKSLAVGAVGGLKGLQSMRPEGDFNRWLNGGDRAGDTHYYALTSDYTPSAAGLASVKNRLMDVIFKGPNDLVVPTDGVFADNGSGFFPIEDKFVFSGTDSLAHTEFFGNRSARDKIMGWLTT